MSDLLTTEIQDDWQILLKMLPQNWRTLASSTKANVRKFRSFKNEEDVIRALMLHVSSGYSLRETATRLKLAKIADVSDVALLKRLQCSENWLKELCVALLKERDVAMVKPCGKIKMRLVDGTNVKEPGKSGSQWRIHYSMLLSDLTCDYFKLTSVNGKGSGESFKQYPVKKNDCIIGDRGYSTAQGITYLSSKKAYSLVRVNTSSLQFYTKSRKKFDLLGEVRKLVEEQSSLEKEVFVCCDGHSVKGRLCIIKKSKAAADLAIKRARRKAGQHQSAISKDTEEYAKFVILFTTLPKNDFPLADVLSLYRLRWQIELVFKRFKSLAGLGHLPKHDEISSRAWLYGKIFTGLLIEKLIAYSKTFSPWGYL